MSNASLPGDLKPLADALRALPQAAPERSAWPELAARLAADARAESAHAAALQAPLGDRAGHDRVHPSAAERARHATLARRRYFVPAALAAAAVLAFAAVQLQRERAAPPARSPVATVAPAAASSVENAAISTNATSTPGAGTAADAQLASLQRRSQALERWLHETARAAGPLPGQDLAAATEIEDMIGLVDGQLNAAPRSAELPLWQRRVALLEDLTALRYSNYKLAEAGVAANTPATWTD